MRKICFIIAFMSATYLHAGDSTTGGYSEPFNQLEARLAVSKAKIRKGEVFEVFLELKNVNEKIIQVQMGNPFVFKAELLDEKGRAITPTSGRIDVICMPRWVVVPAWAYLGIPVSQESHDGAKGSTLDTTKDIWTLKPGKYQLRGTFSSKKFMDDVGDLKRPTDSWSGEIELPAIALEVTE